MQQPISVIEEQAGQIWDVFKLAPGRTVIHIDGLCDECAENTLDDELGLNKPFLINVRAVSSVREAQCWICAFKVGIFMNLLPRQIFIDRWTGKKLNMWKSNYEKMMSEQPLSIVGFAASSLRSFEDDFDIVQDDFCPVSLKLLATPHHYDSPLVTCASKDLLLQRRLATEVNETANFDNIRDWIYDCAYRHADSCNKPSRENLEGLILIDVEQGMVVRAPNNAKYVALSYVIGGTPMYGINMDRQEVKMPKIIPKTISDAFTVVERLGLKYLWVDAYCILAETQDDRQKQINQMDLIYENAYVTICVLSGNNANSGIPGVSHPFDKPTQLIAESKSYVYTALWSPDLQSRFNASPWNTRAWTCQECVLSTRRLCFDDRGVFLVCRQEIFSDLIEHSSTCPPNNYNFSFSRSPSATILKMSDASGAWKFGQYAQMVSSYCSRHLSRQTDAQNAIAGILNSFYRSTGVRFHGGLPVQDLLNGLLWIQPENRWGQNQRRQGFPSWSWLGWIGPTAFIGWVTGNLFQHKPTDSNPEGSWSRLNKVNVRQQAMVQALLSKEREQLLIETQQADFQFSEGNIYNVEDIYRENIVNGYELPSEKAQEFPPNSLVTLILLLELEETPNVLPGMDPDLSQFLAKKEWVMALAIEPRPDGTAERRFIIPIRPDEWRAAEPKPISVLLV